MIRLGSVRFGWDRSAATVYAAQMALRRALHCFVSGFVYLRLFFFVLFVMDTLSADLLWRVWLIAGLATYSFIN